jgi:predicted TIM-barrel fold metal-dependent hydrolase
MFTRTPLPQRTREHTMPTKLLPRQPHQMKHTSRYGAEERDRRTQWRARLREDIIEPGLPIIDAHHHLWARPGDRYFLDDFLADAQTGHNIVASVFVECGQMYRKGAEPLMAPIGEVEFVNGIAAMAASGNYGSIQVAAGIVGTADLSVGPEVARILDAQIQASPRYRGIRLTTKWDADDDLNTGRYLIPPGIMRDADFRAGFAMLGPRKLSFDAMIYHTQLLELADLARAFPDTTIVLNHIGGLLAFTKTYLSRKDETIAQWRSGITALAQCRNVVVKLGGLGMSYFALGFDQRAEPATSAELASGWSPFLLHCIDSFGPARCMFESNFPPDRDSVSYPVIWNVFKRIAARYTPEEKHALFHGTAATAYRLALD